MPARRATLFLAHARNTCAALVACARAPDVVSLVTVCEPVVPYVLLVRRKRPDWLAIMRPEGPKAPVKLAESRWRVSLVYARLLAHGRLAGRAVL